MDYELKDRILTLLLYIQTLIAVSVTIATLIILVYSPNISNIYTVYISLLIASIISCCIFIYFNWSDDIEIEVEFYFNTKTKYILLLILLSLQSLFIPLIAIFIINIAIFKHYLNYIVICFLSSILVSSFCCYLFFRKLNSMFYARSSLIMDNIKSIIIFIQIIFVLINIAILIYI